MDSLTRSFIKNNNGKTQNVTNPIPIERNSILSATSFALLVTSPPCSYFLLKNFGIDASFWLFLESFFIVNVDSNAVIAKKHIKIIFFMQFSALD
jgi:hypothetical protein